MYEDRVVYIDIWAIKMSTSCIVTDISIEKIGNDWGNYLVSNLPFPAREDETGGLGLPVPSEKQMKSLY